MCIFSVLGGNSAQLASPSFTRNRMSLTRNDVPSPEFTIPRPSRSSNTEKSFSPNISLQAPMNGTKNHVPENKNDSSVDVPGPGTPPAKRRKYYFQRCFQPSFNANDISAFRRVLAEDSDQED